MNHPESQLQKACVLWFRFQYPMHRRRLFSIPNGGKRNAREAAILKAEGATAGVPDLFLAIPRRSKHGLFIEMKSGANKCTVAQREFLNDAAEMNYDTMVCRSFDDFKNEITQYLGK